MSKWMISCCAFAQEKKPRMMVARRVYLIDARKIMRIELVEEICDDW
jgi:hypothetical protein